MIRLAQEKDIPRLIELLKQVNLVHAKGRPDIFKIGTKYQEEELKGMLNHPLNPIFVATDDKDITLGYVFCITEQHKDSHLLTDIKTLYIDDLCVDEKKRGLGIGSSLYKYVCQYAKENGYYNITLNVWAINPSAQKFYEHLGLKPLKTYLENIV